MAEISIAEIAVRIDSEWEKKLKRRHARMMESLTAMNETMAEMTKQFKQLSEMFELFDVAQFEVDDIEDED